MSPSTFFKLYAVALPTFLVIDMIWLGLVARSFYQHQMGHLMRANVNWAAYDLTNLATLEGFPLTVALVDLCWGTVLCATVSAITYTLAQRLV